MISNKSTIINGEFLRESKNRFLCEVLIDGKVEECYVPSSSRLENYLKLKGKKVLLKLNSSEKCRTKYSLYAVKYYNKYVLLNLNMVNDIVSSYLEMKLEDNYTDLKKEYKINNYKADLINFNEQKNIKTIIEIKGLISTRRAGLFPIVKSERAVRQLEQLEIMLQSGYSIEYYIVSLSPITREISLNKEDEEFFKKIKSCIQKGMILRGLSVGNIDGEFKIIREIKVIY
ncbi:DNA/RNA nuclease SfsA [Neobacillus mesonae]|uniref:DNA/RNA nuclease SfsA n=1 Tax=Neobacillus mesonae TaxID=1193713 RepID=UPI00082A3E4F|nr:DNA/RNA nuclease SfsA [Neobacillus mesonae]